MLHTSSKCSAAAAAQARQQVWPHVLCSPAYLRIHQLQVGPGAAVVAGSQPAPQRLQRLHVRAAGRMAAAEWLHCLHCAVSLRSQGMQTACIVQACQPPTRELVSGKHVAHSWRSTALYLEA